MRLHSPPVSNRGLCKYFPSLSSIRLHIETLEANFHEQVHGCLNQIYIDVRKLCDERGWDTVDAVIMGGDFQVSVSFISFKNIS